MKQNPKKDYFPSMKASTQTNIWTKEAPKYSIKYKCLDWNWYLESVFGYSRNTYLILLIFDRLACNVAQERYVYGLGLSCEILVHSFITRGCPANKDSTSKISNHTAIEKLHQSIPYSCEF